MTLSGATLQGCRLKGGQIGTYVYRGYAAASAIAASYIRSVEIADNQALGNSVRQAIDTFISGLITDYGNLNAFGQLILLAGPRTINGILVPVVGTAPTNVSFVNANQNRQLGPLSDGMAKRFLLNRNNTADAQNSRHLYARITVAGVQISTRYLIGTTAITSGQTSISNTSTNRRHICANNSSASVAGGLAVGGHGISRNNGADHSRMVAGTVDTVTAASVAPTSGSYTLYGLSSQALDCRIAVASTGAAIDLALMDARVTTYLAALASAGI